MTMPFSEPRLVQVIKNKMLLLQRKIHNKAPGPVGTPTDKQRFISKLRKIDTALADVIARGRDELSADRLTRAVAGKEARRLKVRAKVNGVYPDLPEHIRDDSRVLVDEALKFVDKAWHTQPPSIRQGYLNQDFMGKLERAAKARSPIHPLDVYVELIQNWLPGFAKTFTSVAVRYWKVNALPLDQRSAAAKQAKERLVVGRKRGRMIPQPPAPSGRAEQSDDDQNLGKQKEKNSSELRTSDDEQTDSDLDNTDNEDFPEYEAGEDANDVLGPPDTMWVPAIVRKKKS